MKVLIIGGGGREHAIAAAFAKDNDSSGIYVAPGNAGIALEFPCLPLSSNHEILEWCKSNKPDIVFIGPEKPLAERLADILEENGIPCVGPSQAAARLETSKIFTKGLLKKYNIPTANYISFTETAKTIEYIRNLEKYPVVIKADGLAAGKGVVIAVTSEEALEAISSIENVSEQHTGLVIEEFLSGWEASLFAFCDGEHFQTTLFAQDYKQIGDNDTGANTGGMGACCPVPEAEPYRKQIEEQIIRPILKAMQHEGCPYRGVLYCGLMITAEGPKVLEFNCRLGDPETQALLPLLKTPMADICNAITKKEVRSLKLEWSNDNSVCVVFSAQGYPGNFMKGHQIHISNDIRSRIYYSGVRESDGFLSTNGGRVLSIVASGANRKEAFQKVYKDTDSVDFTGKYFRKDISQRHNTF